MPEHNPIYQWSQNEAIRNNELDLWRESYKENCNCARSIEKTIADNYADARLAKDCAKSVINEYGFDRVNYVLANTLKEKNSDGRFSHENKDWAKAFYIPRDDMRWHFAVESHPGLTDIFLNQTRRAWQELGLLDHTHCISEKEVELDYRGKVVALNPSILKDEYKTPDDQLFFVTGGFGSHANSRGRKVYGHFLKDGEETFYTRQDIIGIVQDEHLPAWAAEKLSETVESQADESESGGMTMGGM